jgi:succinate dehydrogenase / fumarate reductase iron-sulfur subunit
MEISYRILRFNPDRDEAPHYENYRVEVPSSATVLDGLQAIKDVQDGTLTFRRSCRQGICGSCAMRVNNREQLACNTQISHVAQDEGLTVEPLANLAVIKDLAVDMEPFWQKFNAIMPYTVHGEDRPEREYLVSNQKVRHLQQFAGCIQCGACYSACPIVGSDPEYLGPAALAKAYRFVGDPRDAAKKERLGIVGSERGIWRCHTIFNCQEVCPKGVDPTSAIEQLKKATIRRKLGLG